MYPRLYDDNQIQGTLKRLGVWVAFVTSCCLDFVLIFFQCHNGHHTCTSWGRERGGGKGGEIKFKENVGKGNEQNVFHNLLTAAAGRGSLSRSSLGGGRGGGGDSRILRGVQSNATSLSARKVLCVCAWTVQRLRPRLWATQRLQPFRLSDRDCAAERRMVTAVCLKLYFFVLVHCHLSLSLCPEVICKMDHVYHVFDRAKTIRTSLSLSPSLTLTHCRRLLNLMPSPPPPTHTHTFSPPPAPALPS